MCRNEFTITDIINPSSASVAPNSRIGLSAILYCKAQLTRDGQLFLALQNG